MRKRGKKLLAWLMTFSMVSGIVTFPASAEVPTSKNAITDTTTDAASNTSMDTTTGAASNTAVNTTTTTTSEIKNEDNEVIGTVTTTVTETKTEESTEKGGMSSTVTDEITTEVVEKDELYSDVDGETKPTKENEVEMEEDFGGDTPITNNDWEKGDFVPGEFDKVEGTESSTPGERSDVDLDSEYAGEIMIDVPKNTDGTEGNEYAEGSVTVHISMEDALKNDIVYEKEGIQDDGSQVVFIKNDAGDIVGYKVTTYANEKMEDPSEIQPGETSAPDYSNSESKTESVKPSGYEVGTTPILDKDDKEIGSRTIEEIKDENGNVIGYKITETKIVGTKDADGESTAVSGSTSTVPVVKLPEKPTAPAPVTKDGLTTTVTVEDIYENGNLVGYKTITRVTDAKGNEVSKTSDSIYQTVTTYESTVTKDPQTEVETLTTVTEVLGVKETQTYTAETQGSQTTDSFRDVTEEVYQLVETEDGMYFLYEGKVYEVKGESTVRSSNLADDSTINLGQYGTSAEDDDDDLRLECEDTEDYNHTGNDLPNRDTDQSGKWDYDGLGMVSDFEVSETNGKEHRIRQFKMKDQNGNVRYVYCVELGTDIRSGANYGSETYEKGNAVDDQANPWLGANGTIEQLRSVALNGFWGTESGLGSLQAVKDLMIRNGLEKEAEDLTAGMALTATQVAIWQFGSKDPSAFGTVGATDEATTKFDIEKFDTNEEIDGEKAAVINKLRNLLVRLANDAAGEGQADVITKENAFTQAGFVVHDKVDVDVNRDSNEDNDVYNTDVLFKLGVSTSSINGDLIVKVLDTDGKTITSYRLAGEDGEKSIFDGVFTKIYPNKAGVYKMEGIPLAENVKISLALEGIQHLDDGVYVFTNNHWQDFIGLSKLENTVNVSMDMEFKVTDPTVQVEKTTNTWQEKKTDTQHYAKTDTYEEYRLGTSSNATETANTKIYGVTTTVTVETKTTESEREWSTDYDPAEKDENGNQGGGNNGGGSSRPVVIADPDVPLFAGDTIELSDPKVPLSDGAVLNIGDGPIPLAAVPKTGDKSVIWMLLSFISGLGLAGVSFTDRKKR